MSFYGASLNGLQANSLLQNQGTIPKINAKAEDVELKKQTDAFESIIIKMLMDNSMKDEKNIFSAQNDPGDKIYKSMYRDELSKASKRA